MTINVQRLRYELDQGSAFWDDLSERDTLGALVTVVEAAADVYRGQSDVPGVDPMRALGEALHPFDFEAPIRSSHSQESGPNA